MPTVMITIINLLSIFTFLHFGKATGREKPIHPLETARLCALHNMFINWGSQARAVHTSQDPVSRGQKILILPRGKCVFFLGPVYNLD
jgi:hypothetical protein